MEGGEADNGGAWMDILQIQGRSKHRTQTREEREGSGLPSTEMGKYVREFEG